MKISLSLAAYAERMSSSFAGSSNQFRQKMCIAGLSLASLSSVYAEETKGVSIDSISTSPINISAIMEYPLISKSPERTLPDGIIATIHKEDIDINAVQTIQGLLEYVSCIDVRQRGSNGVQADVSVRGSSPNEVLVLIDGINITDPQTGGNNLNIPIDLSIVKRIEILESSSARMYGESSVGGIINIITEEPYHTKVNIEITAGQHGYTSQDANVAFVVNSRSLSSNFVSFSRQASDGFKDNTDFAITNVYLNSTFASEKVGKLQFQFGFQNKEFGADRFYSFEYPDQYQQTKTFLSTLKWNKDFSDKLSLQAHIYWRMLQDQFELFPDLESAPSFYTDHDYHQTDVTGGQVGLGYTFCSTANTFWGIKVRNEHILSNSIGDPMDDTRSVSYAKDAVFTHEKSRLFFNVFTENEVKLNKFTLVGGANLNYSEDYDANISGGLNLNYDITYGLGCYVSGNYAYRIPTFNELYYNSPVLIPNADLKAEKSAIYEAGLKYGLQRWKASAAVYYRMTDDAIDWVKVPDSIRWESRNLTEINTLGTDVSLHYMFNKKLLQKIGLSYSFANKEKDAGEYDSQYELDYLKHNVTLALHYKVFKKLNVFWNISWQDRNGEYLDFESGEWEEYDPFLLINLKVQWMTKNIIVYADVNNFLGQKYADFGGLEQSKRWLKTGIRVTF